MEQVRREQAGLRAFVRSLGLRPDAADDVAQEAFVVAFEKLAVFERGTNFGAWLRTIARFLVSKERRREERRQRLIGDFVAGALADETQATGSADAWAGEAPERADALRHCLGTLPGHSRRLVQQRYFENVPPAVIASQQGRTANDVRQALFRLRAVLHDCIRRRLAEQPL